MLIGAVALVLCAYFGLRLTLAEPATADNGRIMVLRSWPLTKGRVLLILVSALSIYLPVLLILTVLVGIVSQAASAGITPPQHLDAGPALTGGLLAGMLSAGVLEPLLAGVFAYYYRHAKAPDPKP